MTTARLMTFTAALVAVFVFSGRGSAAKRQDQAQEFFYNYCWLKASHSSDTHLFVLKVPAYNRAALHKCLANYRQLRAPRDERQHQSAEQSGK